MTGLDAERVRRAYLADDGGLRDWGKAVFNQLQPQVAYTEFAFREHLYALLREQGWLSGTVALNDRRVLEIGCGWGRNFPLYLDMGVSMSNISGVDLLEPMVERARSQYPQARLFSGDVSVLTELHGAHDLVIMHTTMSAVLDEEVHRVLLTSASACLRPGGVLVIMDIVEGYKEGRVKAGGEDVVFIRPVSRSTLRRLSRPLGLAEIKDVELGLKPRWRNGIYGHLGRWVRGPLLLRVLADVLHWWPAMASHYLLAWKKV